MKAKIELGLSVYWGSVAQVIDLMAAITMLGAIGSLPTVFKMVANYASAPLKKIRGRTLCALRHQPCA
jgi:hypothetical protein